MSQNMSVAPASLGAPPRRHRETQPDQNSGQIMVGTSMSARFGDNEWEARESQRQRELEEARARAAQMEKTMKWWSDCTANWREKWSKVRNERNKSRDEAKQLRTSLEAAVKDANSYKREKNELELQITQMKKEMEKIHMLMMKHAGQFNKGDGPEEPERDGRDNCSPDISSDGLKNVNSEDGLVIKTGIDHSENRDLDIEEYILQGAVPKHVIESFKDDDRRHSAEERRLIQQLSKDDFDEEYLMQKISMLQLRLDEAQKTIQVERDERTALHKDMEKVVHEMQDTKDKCEELRGAKQDAVRELLTLQEQQRAELRIINNTLLEETTARENLERRLSELRTELERLQAENAAEWGKRERLETEKLVLERDNKKMRAEVRDLQERAERRGRPVTNSDAEIRTLQQELADKNKEIADIRHSHSKLKKMLAEANTELGHAVRRAEQYETEVKRLRTRVEELKRELAAAEDELDSACNHVRRLQRTNEELSGQSEGLQVQIQHLQTRHAPISPKQHQLHHELYNSAVSGKTNYPPDCKPNINDLRQLFDSSRYDYKRNFGGGNGNGGVMVSSPVGMGGGAAAYSDAKPSTMDENVLESKIGMPRNVDFERAKQKFDKPTSLRLNSKAMHTKQMLGNFLKLGQSSGAAVASKRLVETAHGSEKPRNDSGGGGGCGGGGKKDKYNMNCSMNLDELKVSDDDTT